MKDYNRNVAIISSAILAVIPFNVIVSKIAFEKMLFPFFSSVSFFLLFKYAKSEDNRFLYLMYFFLGLGVMSDMSFIPILLFFSIFTFLVKLKGFRVNIKNIFNSVKTFFIIFLVTSLALFPIIVHNVTYNFPIMEDFSKRKSNAVLQPDVLLNKYMLFYTVLHKILDGGAIYLRVVGSVLFNIYMINFVLFILSSLFLLKSSIDKKLKLFLLFFVSFYLMFVPLFLINFAEFHFAIRYFLSFLPLGVIPIAVFLSRIFKANKKIGTVIITVFLLLNLFSLTLNFFYSMYVSGGDSIVFDIGFPEVSTASMLGYYDIAGLVTNYPKIYFYNPGYFDILSTFQFLTYNKTEIQPVRGITDANKVYFGVDFYNENKTYQYVENLSSICYNVDEIIISNRLNQPRFRLYIIKGINYTNNIHVK